MLRINKEKFNFATLKLSTILSESHHIHYLQFLFHKEGFSYSIKSEIEKSEKIFHFKVQHSKQWEDEILKEISTNLNLRRNFQEVRVGFVSSFFNLVPKTYSEESAEALLVLSEAEFEENVLFKSDILFDCSLIYGTSQKLVDLLNKQYSKVEFMHSAALFLNFLEKSEAPTLHLNLIENQLEVAGIEKNELIFYNLFDTTSNEDILFFTLFTLEQLNWNPNKIPLNTYGQLLANSSGFQSLRKYVRYVNMAHKNEIYLENYSLFNLTK